MSEQKYFKNLGWRPDHPDFRDAYFAVRPRSTPLPRRVDLRNSAAMPSLYDQGDLGSCTANSIGSMFEFVLRKENKPDFMPSRLFIYYNERKIEGTIRQDAGAQIRDGLKVVNKVGVCPESSWPYVEKKFTNKPPAKCYTQAVRHTALQYARVVQTASQMKGCLAEGYPFVFGFTIYESFEGDDVAKTGIMPIPGHGEKSLGGHAIKAVGYDDDRQVFIIKNSWGTSWGDGGYFYMPYSYALDENLSDDFWTIRSIG